MGPNLNYKHLYSKGKHQQDEKTIWEKIFASDPQGLNFQNIQTAHTIFF